MRHDFVFTSESVTAGHPDKLCDRISDAIVDAVLVEDPGAAVIAECAATKGLLFLDVRTSVPDAVDFSAVARQVVAEAGYTDGAFNAEDCTIMATLGRIGPRDGNALVARQQVTLFGYACSHTPAMLPLPIYLAHRLVQRLDTVREAGDLPYLRPDGQSQVAVGFKDRKPMRLAAISLITATAENGAAPDTEQLCTDLQAQIIDPVFADEAVGIEDGTHLFVNPGGPVPGGGPVAHAGLTGRKTGADTYGEYCRHSGSALSGKDPTRIDRIGAYAARYAARNVVAAGLAGECEVQLSYGIGQADPISLQVDTFGSGAISAEEIETRLLKAMDFSPAGIIERFGLRDLPRAHEGKFYSLLASYGHFGRGDLDLPWEAADLAEALS